MVGVRGDCGQSVAHGFDLGACGTRDDVGQPIAANESNLGQRGVSLDFGGVVQAVSHGGEDGVGIVTADREDEGKREFVHIGGVESQ